MPALIAAFAADRPDEVAIVDARGSTTWREVDDRVARLRDALLGLGLRTGSTVLLMTGNERAAIEVILACMHTGLLVVPVNAHWVADEVAYVLEDTGAEAVIASDARLDVARKAMAAAGSSPVLVVVSDQDHPGAERYDDLIARSDPATEEERFGGPMFYTSGTTGRPKGVRSRLNAIGGPATDWKVIAEGIGQGIGISGPGSTLLLTGPIYHSVQWVYSFGTLLNGSTVVVQPRFDPAAVLADIDRHQVTHLHLVPTQMLRLLRLDEAIRDGFSGASLQRAYHGAAPCPDWVKRAMIEWWGPIITEYYGGTEAGFLTTISSTEWLERPGSVGRPGPNVEVTVVDAEGRPVPPRQHGVVQFRSRQGHDFEYHNAEAKTAEAHPEPGVGTLGDIGWFDEEGYLFLSDRSIDMIVSGGVNIYPAEIEAVLSEHPALVDVSVVGLPEPEMGEQVVAVVQTQPGRLLDEDLEAELESYCRERLAGYKCPRQWTQIEEMPRNEAGKVPKHQLRGTIAERVKPTSAD
jgi:long-chain acyl-CoA synthetase